MSGAGGGAEGGAVGAVPAKFLEDLGEEIERQEAGDKLLKELGIDPDAAELLGDPEALAKFADEIGVDLNAPLSNSIGDADMEDDGMKDGKDDEASETTCQGCIDDLANQRAHMEPGGCLWVPDFTDEEIQEAVDEMMAEEEAPAAPPAPDGLNSYDTVKLAGRKCGPPKKLDL